MVIEIDKKWATVVYIAVSILSALLIADKESAVMYIAFFGYYPIVKQPIEKHLNKYLAWVIKLLIFNISIIASYLLLIYVFNLDMDDFGEFTKTALILLYLAFNVVFVFVFIGKISRSGVAGSHGSFIFLFFEEPPYCFPQWLYQFTNPTLVHKSSLFSCRKYIDVYAIYLIQV